MTSLLAQLSESFSNVKQGDFVYFGPLFRGSREQFTGDPFYKLPIRTDRKPRDSGVLDTHLFNLLFELQHGVKNIRNRCIFGTPDYHAATSYTGTFAGGAVSVLLLPKGTKIAFNPEVEDSGDPVDSIPALLANVKTSTGETIESALSLTDPVSVIELIHDLAENLDEDKKSRLEHELRECQKNIKGYKVIEVVNDTPNIPFCEYMIFDQPFVYAITIDELAKHNTYDGDDEAPIDDYGMPVDNNEYAVVENAFDIIKGIVADASE